MLKKKDIVVGRLLAFHNPQEPHYYPVAVLDVSTLWGEEKVIAGERMYEPVAGSRCHPGARDGHYLTGYLTVVPQDREQADGTQIAEDIRAWLPTLPVRLTEDVVNAMAREMPPTLQISLESPRYFIDTWKAHRAAVDAGTFEAEVQRKRRRRQLPEPSTFVHYIWRIGFRRHALDLTEVVVEDADSVTLPTAVLARLLGFDANNIRSFMAPEEGPGYSFLDSAGALIHIGDTVRQASASGLRWSHEELGALQVNAGKTGVVVGIGRSRVRVDFGRTKKIHFGSEDTGEPVIDTVYPDMLTVQKDEGGSPVPKLSVNAALALWHLRHNPGEYTTKEIAEAVSVARHLVRPEVHRLAELGLACEASPGSQVKRWVLDGSPEQVDAILAHYEQGIESQLAIIRKKGG